jgi:hypothetical protein
MDFAGLPRKRAARYLQTLVEERVRPVTEAADQRQADYFVHLLDQICRRINNRIERYQRATTLFEASGDADYACVFRRMALLEEEDRQMLHGLLDNLQRRFFPPAPE